MIHEVKTNAELVGKGTTHVKNVILVNENFEYLQRRVDTPPSWDWVVGKPEMFPPETHNHDINDLEGISRIVGIEENLENVVLELDSVKKFNNGVASSISALYSSVSDIINIVNEISENQEIEIPEIPENNLYEDRFVGIEQFASKLSDGILDVIGDVEHVTEMVGIIETKVDGNLELISTTNRSLNELTNVVDVTLERVSGIEDNVSEIPNLERSIVSLRDEFVDMGERTSSIEDNIKGIEIDIRNSNEHLSELNSLQKCEFYTSSGKVSGNVKVFTGVAVATDGFWSIDFSFVGFTQVFSIQLTGEAIGAALSEKRIPSLSKGGLTTTSASGHLMSSSSAGLLAAMTMVNGSGNVYVTVVGV